MQSSPTTTTTNTNTINNNHTNTNSNKTHNITNSNEKPVLKVTNEKLFWASVKVSPIYTIDFHPDGNRFATSQDGKVYIWRAKGLENNHFRAIKEGVQISKDAKVKSSQSKTKDYLISTIDTHDKSCNCIRFSPNGKMIGIGSDDFTVSIHELVKAADMDIEKNPEEQETDVFLGRPKNFEEWKILKLFRGHEKDVFGIAWSHNSKMMASCSVDNKVLIYDVESLVIIKELKEHKNIVKGVSFDPIGKYLISQCDNSLIVWSLANWNSLAIITNPFPIAQGNGLYFRISWAPDGSSFIAANGYVKGYVAPVISRSDFKNKFELSGHKDAIIVSQFNPVIFQDKNNPNEPVCYIALGSADRNISIWSTKSYSSIAVFRNFFGRQITDIAWSKDGYKMLCCSLDGSVGYFHFGRETFGDPMPQDKVQRLLSDKYGDINAISHTSILEYPPINIPASESTAITSLISQQSLPSQSEYQASSTKTSTTKVNVSQSQRETITKDGRRRITPVLIESSAKSSSVAAETPQPNPFTDQFPTFVQPPVLEKHVSTNDESVIQERLDISRVPTSEKSQQKRPAESTSHSSSSRKRQRIALNSSESRTPTTPHTTTTTAPSSSVIEQSSRPIRPHHIKIGDSEEIFFSGNCQIHYKVSGATKWSAFLGDELLLGIGNPNFIALSSKKFALHIFSKAGRRILPPIILDSQIFILSCNSNYHLIALTQSKLYLWNVKKQESIIQCDVEALSKQFGTSSKIEIDDVLVSDNGNPVVTLNNGESYTYHQSMKAWICIADAHTPLTAFATSAPHLYQSSTAETNGSLLRTLRQKAMENVVNQHPVSASNDISSQSLDDLEIYLSASALLGESGEYQHSLKSYARFLVASNDTDRLEELCDELLGPVRRRTPNSEPWCKNIAGISKHALLKEVLAIMSGKKEFQRMVIKYQDCLSEN